MLPTLHILLIILAQISHASVALSAAKSGASPKLIKNQLYDFDANPPLRISGAWKHYQNKVLYDGPLPKATDFHQGLLGNCFFIQTLAALTIADPNSVKDMIVPQETKGHYIVKLFSIEAVGRVVNVAVDDKVAMTRFKKLIFLKDGVYKRTVQSSMSGKLVLWPLLFEKAFVKYMMAFKNAKGYKSVDDGGSSEVAMMMLTSKEPEKLRMVYWPEVRLLLDTIAASDDNKKIELFTLQNGKRDVRAIVAETPKNLLLDENISLGENKGGCLRPNHVHPVERFDRANMAVILHCDLKGEKLSVPLNVFIHLFEQVFLDRRKPMEIATVKYSVSVKANLQPLWLTSGEWVETKFQGLEKGIEPKDVRFPARNQHVTQSVLYVAAVLRGQDLKKLVMKTKRGFQVTLGSKKVQVDAKVPRNGELTHSKIPRIEFNENDKIWPVLFMKAIWKLLEDQSPKDFSNSAAFSSRHIEGSVGEKTQTQLSLLFGTDNIVWLKQKQLTKKSVEEALATGAAVAYMNPMTVGKKTFQQIVQVWSKALPRCSIEKYADLKRAFPLIKEGNKIKFVCPPTGEFHDIEASVVAKTFNGIVFVNIT